MSKFIDLQGKIFGRLTVLSCSGKDGNDHLWLCKCSCGKEHVVCGRSLKSNSVKSCGCLRSELQKEKAENLLRLRNKTHGLSRVPEYGIWRSMILRCESKGALNYKHYGSRGIMVCERWHTYENFINDMGGRPSKEHSIDRIDVNGNYEPSNCRWATKEQQAANKRNNVYATVDGETHHAAEWARKKDIAPSAIHNRVNVQGLSIEEAISKPVPLRPNSKLTDVEAIAIWKLQKTRSARSVAAEYGIDKKSVANIWNSITFADVCRNVPVTEGEKEKRKGDYKQTRFIEADGLRLSLTEWAERLGVNMSAIQKRLKLGWSEYDAVTLPKGHKPK